MASTESRIIYFLGQKVTAMRNRAALFDQKRKAETNPDERIKWEAAKMHFGGIADEVETWISEIRTGGLK